MPRQLIRERLLNVSKGMPKTSESPEIKLAIMGERYTENRQRLIIIQGRVFLRSTFSTIPHALLSKLAFVDFCRSYVIRSSDLHFTENLQLIQCGEAIRIRKT